MKNFNVMLDKLNAKVDTKTDKLDGKLDKLRADVAAHRAETAKGFAALDKELAGHADPGRGRSAPGLDVLDAETGARSLPVPERIDASGLHHSNATRVVGARDHRFGAKDDHLRGYCY